MKMMDSEFVASLGLFVASSLFFSIGRRRCVKERLLLASNRSPRPENRVDYRAEGGPLLEYLWCDGLKGQSLYLGGEVGSDGKIYFIPGHAKQVLQLDPTTDALSLIGPLLHGKFKWLRGVPVGDIIYGLPCHADSVLRIHVPTGSVTTITIPYDSFYELSTDKVPSGSANEGKAHEEQHRQWKYHGGTICPIDGCIYAIPQSARHVLRVDPKTDSCALVGPSLEGRWKWYGGVVGKSDGAIYGIPHNSPSVLRITPDRITLHGDFSSGGSHQWHGATAAPDGTIVCVPANGDTVLCIRPNDPAPALLELSDSRVIRTGTHRNDRRYKYLGATAGSDGLVYIFPSGSEYVLQVDTTSMKVHNVGPNMVDCERLRQNKWQNGILGETCVYGIPLAAESLLRIDCSMDKPKITTWPLPAPCQGLAKYEGGVAAPSGILYTVPNNHKGVLRIQPAGWIKPRPSDSNEWPSKRLQRSYRSRGQKDDENMKYKSGIPTLRSSAHRVKFAPSGRRQDPAPRNAQGVLTGTVWLPSSLLQASKLSVPHSSFGSLKKLLVELLEQCDAEIVGCFPDGDVSRLEDFRVPPKSTWRSVNGGQCEQAQKYLSNQVASNAAFLQAFDRLVSGVVIPHVKQQLVAASAVAEHEPLTFYYQRPPTIRLQPGPAWAQVKPHNDAEYGHQNGEINFWMPFTNRDLTTVDLWCESSFQADDYRCIPCPVGDIVRFHGSSCRHYVNSNGSEHTRVSLDFRVGVQGFFDPTWQMKGTSDDHGRTEFTL